MATKPDLKAIGAATEQKVGKQAKPKSIRELKAAQSVDLKKAAYKQTQENTQQSALSENFQI